jgi:DNA-binding IscR family transcriptional regulator
LENILKSLRDRGLVVSTRGPGGGYAIRDEGADSSVWDVVAIFEDTLVPVAAAPGAHAHPVTSYELGLEQVIRQTLSGFKITDVKRFEEGSVAATPARAAGRFKFKPLAAAKPPRAANSVFQWHMVSTNNVVFDAP